MESNMPEMIASVMEQNTSSYKKSQQDAILENIIDELRKDPRVAHVQKNFVYTTESVNDPSYPLLWAMNNE
jgi:hypothetical protein